MNAQSSRQIGQRLSERDEAILESLEKYRLLDTRMIQRLHFHDHHSELAAARATGRTMQRLRSVGVVSALERRVGGVRRGSASFVWQLAATGERYLRAIRGQAHRRRFLEPGLTFVSHTLAVNDVAVRLVVANRTQPTFTIEELVTEPANWHSYLGTGGETRWLKPDLHLIAGHQDADGEYEAHSFLEVDLGTEHVPRIQAKCQMYATYWSTGIYQAEHGLFPEVIWINDDLRRRATLRAAIAATRGLPTDLFRVTSTTEYLAGITGESNQQLGGQEGGNPS